MDPSRRVVLQLGAYSAVFVYVGGCRRTTASSRSFLTAAEYATVVAACDRILPADDDPGAIDLGVPDYIDKALAAEPRWQERFRAGLAALDTASHRRASTSYADASAKVQDNILSDWHDGRPDQVDFIHRLVGLTLEGAFGDPSHGGNRDGAGWQLIGFEPSEPRPHV